MAHAMPRSELLETLERLLAEVLRLKQEGATYDRMGRAQGFLDGYMCALLDAGVVTQAELLELVRRERTIASGAPTREVAALTAAVESAAA